MTADEPTPAQLQAAVEQLEAEMERGESASGPWIQAVRERALRLAAEERHAEALAQIRVQQSMLDTYHVDLAAMRKRAEAAERELVAAWAVVRAADLSPQHLWEGISALSKSADERDTLRAEVARLSEALCAAYNAAADACDRWGDEESGLSEARGYYGAATLLREVAAGERSL